LKKEEKASEETDAPLTDTGDTDLPDAGYGAKAPDQ
jgi:hypothetical protein